VSVQNLSIIGFEGMTQTRQAGQSLGGRVTPCHEETLKKMFFFNGRKRDKSGDDKIADERWRDMLTSWYTAQPYIKNEKINYNLMHCHRNLKCALT
jgi:hypothetical protein